MDKNNRSGGSETLEGGNAENLKNMINEELGRGTKFYSLKGEKPLPDTMAVLNEVRENKRVIYEPQIGTER